LLTPPPSLFLSFALAQPQEFYLKPPALSEYRHYKAKRKPLLEVTNDGYE